MGDCLLSNFNFAKLHFDQSNIKCINFILEISKLFMLEIFLFAVFDDELTKRTCR